MAFTSDKTRQGAAGAGAGGYTIDKSLRFEDGDNPYLSTSLSGTGGRDKFTYSGWVKLGNIGVQIDLLSAPYSTSQNGSHLQINSSGYFYNQIRNYSTGSQGGFDGDCTSDMIFRDPSAWYHIVFVYNSTDGTASNRQKLYVNGVPQTFSAQDTVTENYVQYIGSQYTSRIGVTQGTTGNLDGYLAEVNFIDGQALDSTHFGEFGDYGEWKPKAYTGTYGTNGFYLDFKDASDLGNDANYGNDWSSSGIETTDQMIDTPTNNFATLNPLDKNSATVLAEGNLKQTDLSATWRRVRGTIGISSGAYYWEVLITNTGADGAIFGVANKDCSISASSSDAANAWAYSTYGSAYLSNQTTNTSYGESITGGDIVGVALDMDTGDIEFFKNNVSQGVLATGLTGELFPLSNLYDNHDITYNFGQDSSFAGTKTAGNNSDSNGIGDFFYEPPDGFLALCTANLPVPDVIPSEHFNTVTYSADGTAQDITTVGFQPDLAWVKSTNTTSSHYLHDSVRGGNKSLSSNTSSIEDTATGQLDSFLSNGFELPADSGGYINYNGRTYVAWNWKAGGAVSADNNTVGTITSTVSANQDAGFSIVGYTGNNSTNQTVGHGLLKKPEMVIIKNRDEGAAYWSVINPRLVSTTDVNILYLNVSNAEADDTNIMGTNMPNSTTFGVDNYRGVNYNNEKFIAYCFHSVDGYSKVGSYTGNGSTDGTFVYTGFRPAYVMIKGAVASGNSWAIRDNSRSPYNVMSADLFADTSAVEASDIYRYTDFTSNGFKHRSLGSDSNTLNQTYIYIAFAETPFKYANAR